MCGQCGEIDIKIERLRFLVHRILDQQARDGIAGLIAELEAQKAALHPE